MYREKSNEYIAQLSGFINETYNLIPVRITPAKRGYYGETWRIDTETESYFVKIVRNKTHIRKYKRSFAIIDHMNRHGIDFISTVKRAADGSLFTNFNDAVFGLFNWIDGNNVQNEYTKLHEYNMLARIYTIPTQGLCITHNDFTTESAESFFKQWSKLEQYPNNTIVKIFEVNRSKIDHLYNRLKLFAKQCNSDLSHRYITHGDAGGNIIISGEHCYLVDWDDPVIASPERDAWFCLHWDWAMDAFNKALRDNGINYTSRSERLAYYCYYSFFSYLTNYMNTYFEFGDINGELSDEIANYLQSSWINDNISYADTFY